jgi:N6-adenosine-specific RNA methylase IME4
MAKMKKLQQAATPELVQQVLAGDVSINAAYQATVRGQAKAERIEQLDAAPDLPDAKYRILYVDPPWHYQAEQHTSMGGIHKAPLGKHYPSLSIEELCALPVADVALDDAVLFLWATSPQLEAAFSVIRAWGFQYKTSMVWDKVLHNVGHYVSVRHELLLICTRGSCLPDVKKLHDSVYSEERTEHSRKPEYFRNLIDELYPHGKRIELFARGPLPDGWGRWGNE